MPRGRIKSFPRFFSPEKKGKNQKREAANINRANTQGNIYPFANTVVFQNVTRASESLRPLWRKKYVHDSLQQHNARCIKTQMKPMSESILYNTSVLSLTCRNQTTVVECMEEWESASLNPQEKMWRCDTEEQETVTNSETHHLTFYKLSCDPALISMSWEVIFHPFYYLPGKKSGHMLSNYI